MRYLLIGIIWLACYISGYAQPSFVEFSTIPKSGTALVLSHQDDDVIWMLPFWKITEKFIGGAMPSTSTYEKIIHDQQVYLDNSEPGIDYESNWFNPWGSITHQEYDGYYGENLPEYNYLANDHIVAYWTEAIFRSETDRIKSKLEQYIASPEVSRIITHNNWGEYGHPHHKGINKAIRELAVKYRKDVWMLGCTYIYGGEFVNVPIPDGITYTLGNFDPELFTALRNIYMDWGRWTWQNTWTPSGDYNFIKIVENGHDKSDVLITGEPVTTPGPLQDKPGAYIFDGIDDYMTLPSNLNTSFTISLWVRPEQTKEMDISRMAEYPASQSYDRSFHLNSNGQVIAKINDGSSKTVISNALLIAKNWTHIAMTSDGSTLKLYINGTQDNFIGAGTPVTAFTTPEFVLGQAKETGFFFEGQINDVQLYDYALSSEEITSIISISPPARFTITASAGIGGTINPSGQNSVIQGSNLTYNITPSTKYTIDDVIVDGVSQGGISSYTFNSVIANHTITATFITISVALNKPTTCSSFFASHESSLANDKDYSNNSHWSAEPNPQWWKVDLGNLYDISEIVIRNFVDGRYYKYNIEASIDNVGYTKIIDKTNENPATDQGDSYSLSTVARYLRVNITYSSLSQVARISDFRVFGTMISTRSITASAGTGGTIAPSGTVSVNHGTNQTFAFTPNSGYQIADVTVDGTSIGKVSSFTFNNVIADHNIGVSFSVLTTTNVALNKPTTCQSFILGNESSKANDATGDNTSYWAAKPYSKWWKVDLGALYDLTSITIRNFVAGSRYYQYNVQASNNDVNYTRIASKANRNTATNAGDTYPVNTTARYLRVNMTYSSANMIVQISDFRAYGTPSTGLPSYSLTSSSGPNGSITPLGTITVSQNSSYTYSINANIGYQVSNVIVDGKSVSPASSYTFNSITANHTITATFSSINTYTITSSAGAGGTISPVGETILNQGASQTYLVSPNNGYEISDVTADGVSIGKVSTYTFNNISGNHTIAAIFIPFHIITARAGENGTITPMDEVIVPQNGSRIFTITPDAGFKIGEVLVDGIPIENPSSTYTFTNVVADHTINVFFESVFIITARAGENGTITPMDEVLVPMNGSQMFTITPDLGFQIGEVLVDGLPIENPSFTYTFTNVTADHTINAFFQVSGSKGNSLDSPSLKQDPKTEAILNETVLSFYPNPFKDKFILRIDSQNDEMFDISVIGLNGSKVYLNTRIEGNTDNTFNLHLNQGIYILKVRDKERIMIQRIVKY
jgi:ABC-type transporter MlaC component